MRAFRDHPPRRVLTALAAAVTLGLVGCGGTTTTTTTTVVKVTAAPTATIPTSTAVTRRPMATRQSVRSAQATRWTTCDANIRALSPHTSCPFAQNAFYEYWSSGGDSPLEVYSPAVGRTFTTSCEDRGPQVLCRTDDGGRARFSSSAVAAYDADQAGAYVATHDTGTDSTSSTVGAAADGTADDDVDEYEGSGASDDLSGDEIPNYDEGTGSRVQCADGMYSRSGGRPGACSGHGGVG